ncbi:uncharacterized protein LOC127854983 [Dreissena polymorpha]|uniref:C2H2-type domain-containing protein n=1 Tax=Dreissena polymorpha TaxID=45954 RepID=A0A9D4C8F5_DREPO|nr:uncharacterized protein LOC127854983 [Dreissena polymorpha]KAH3719378.1 hypothetical protein DPMN_062210 [Dreissena polymorpha]
MQNTFDGQDAYISYLMHEIVKNTESPLSEADQKSTQPAGKEEVTVKTECPVPEFIQIDVNPKFQYHFEDSDRFSVQRRNVSSISTDPGGDDFSLDYSFFATGQSGAFSLDNSVTCTEESSLQNCHQFQPSLVTNTWNLKTGLFINAGNCSQEAANVRKRELKKSRKRKSENSKQCTQIVNDTELKQIVENNKKTFLSNNFYFKEFMKMPKQDKTVESGCIVEPLKTVRIEIRDEVSSAECVKIEVHPKNNDTCSNDTCSIEDMMTNKNVRSNYESSTEIGTIDIAVKGNDKEHLCSTSGSKSLTGTCSDIGIKSDLIKESPNQESCLCVHCAELLTCPTDLEQHIRDKHNLKNIETPDTATTKHREEVAYYLASVELDKKLLKQRKEAKEVENAAEGVIDESSQHHMGSLEDKQKQAEYMLKQKEEQLKAVRERKKFTGWPTNLKAGMMKSGRISRTCVSKQKQAVSKSLPRSVRGGCRGAIVNSASSANHSYVESREVFDNKECEKNADRSSGKFVDDVNVQETSLNAMKKAVICLERISTHFDDVTTEVTQMESVKIYKSGSKASKNNDRQNLNDEGFLADKKKESETEQFIEEADTNSTRQSRAKNNLLNPSKGKQKRVISPRSQKDELLMKQFGIIPSKVFLDKVSAVLKSTCSGTNADSGGDTKCAEKAVNNTQNKTRTGQVPLSVSDSGINVDFSDSGSEDKETALIDFDTMLVSGTGHTEGGVPVKKLKMDETTININVKAQTSACISKSKRSPTRVLQTMDGINMRHKNKNENNNSKQTEKFFDKNMSVSVSPKATNNSHASRPNSPKKGKIGPRSKAQESLNLPSIESLSSDEMSKLLNQCGMSISVPTFPLKKREETPEPSTSKGHGHRKRKRTARKSCVDNELVKKYNLKESIVKLECLSKSEVLMLRNPHSKFGKNTSWLQQKFDTDSESEMEWEIPSPTKSEDFVEDENNYVKQVKTSKSEDKQNVVQTFKCERDEELLKKFGISDAKVVVESQCLQGQSCFENKPTVYVNKSESDYELSKKFGIPKLVVVATKADEASVTIDMKSDDFKDFFQKSIDATKKMIAKPKTELSRNSLAENEAETNATKELNNVSKEKTQTRAIISVKKPKPKSQRKENKAEGPKLINKVCKTPALKTRESTGDHVFTSTPKVVTKSVKLKSIGDHMFTSTPKVETKSVKLMQRTKTVPIVAANSTEKLEKDLQRVRIRLPMLSKEEIDRYTKQIAFGDKPIEVMEQNKSDDINDTVEDEIVKEQENGDSYQKRTLTNQENNLSKLESENSRHTTTESQVKCVGLIEKSYDRNCYSKDFLNTDNKLDEVDGSFKEDTIIETEDTTGENLAASVEEIGTDKMELVYVKDVEASKSTQMQDRIIEDSADVKMEVTRVQDQSLEEIAEGCNDNLNDSECLVKNETMSTKTYSEKEDRLSLFNQMVIENNERDSETKESSMNDEDDILELDVSADTVLNDANVENDKGDSDIKFGTAFELNMENACM